MSIRFSHIACPTVQIRGKLRENLAFLIMMLYYNTHHDIIRQSLTENIGERSLVVSMQEFSMRCIPLVLQPMHIHTDNIVPYDTEKETYYVYVHYKVVYNFCAKFEIL